MSQRFQIFGLTFSCLYIGALMLLLVLIHNNLQSLNADFEKFNSLSSSQVIDNWKKPFLTDILVVDEETECPSSEPLFTYAWQGLEQVYMVRGTNGQVG